MSKFDLKSYSMPSNATSVVEVQAYPVENPTMAENVSTSTNQEFTVSNHHSNGSYPQIPTVLSTRDLSGTINEGGVREFLSEQKWPVGLQDTMIKGLNKIPLRYFICDDSGSMNESDGSRLIRTGNSYMMVKCTRWAELTQALKFHVDLAACSGTQTEFRLLNGSSPISINPQNRDSAQVFKSLLDGDPGGGTPLCRHIREVIQEIQQNEQYLRANNQRACVIIATDGESSDGNIVDVMRPLERLPCWVVIRLCTNDDRIVDYWNNIDSLLELEMDVLDDLQGEANEIYRYNNWFTYGEPLHRLREFGIPIKEIDMIDERQLTSEQMRVVASVILGGRPDSYPHPEIDRLAFMSTVEQKLANVHEVWDPVNKRLSPWLKLKAIEKKLNPSGGCTIS